MGFESSLTEFESQICMTTGNHLILAVFACFLMNLKKKTAVEKLIWLFEDWLIWAKWLEQSQT